MQQNKFIIGCQSHMNHVIIEKMKLFLKKNYNKYVKKKNRSNNKFKINMRNIIKKYKKKMIKKYKNYKKN